MLHRLREKLSYANVVATLALFVALGGSAYAIGVGAIGSREVRDDSLRARDIDERGLRALPGIYRRTRTVGVARGVLRSEQVDCKRGDVALSGGVNAVGHYRDPGVELLQASPARRGGGPFGAKPPNAWRGVLRYGTNGAAGSYGFEVYAICAAKPRR